MHGLPEYMIPPDSQFADILVPNTRYKHALLTCWRCCSQNNNTVGFFLNVLNFCKFTYKWSGWISNSYCSLKPFWLGMGVVVPIAEEPRFEKVFKMKVRLYSSRRTWSLTGACAKKRNNTVFKLKQK